MPIQIVIKNCATGATEAYLNTRQGMFEIREGPYDDRNEEALFDVTIESRGCSWSKVDRMVDEFFRANTHIPDGRDYVWRAKTDYCGLRAARGEFRSPEVVKQKLRDAVAKIIAEHKIPDFVAGGRKASLVTSSVLLGALTLQGPQLYLVDPGLSSDDKEGLRVDVPGGIYEVSVRILTVGQTRRVSHLRALLQGHTPSRRDRIGQGAVDTGRFAICDHQHFRRVCNGNDDSRLTELLQRMGSQSYGLAELSGVLVFFSEAGLGDGSCPVFELRDSAQRIGVEVEFIGDED